LRPGTGRRREMMTEKYWRLTPQQVENRAWARSTLVEPIIVIAESEKDAREKAGIFLDIACRREKFEETIVIRPWEREDLVIVQEIDAIPESFPKSRIIFPDDPRDKFS
jgi:hypothetical protein